MIFLDFTMSPTMVLLVECILRTARMVGVVAGGLVLFETLSPYDSTRPFDRRKSARAWTYVALGALVGGMLSLYSSYGTREPRVDVSVARVLLWIGLSTGLVMRSALSAERPKVIWTVAALIALAGFALSLVDAFLV